jgi:hypothetical protein
MKSEVSTVEGRRVLNLTAETPEERRQLAALTGISRFSPIGFRWENSGRLPRDCTDATLMEEVSHVGASPV